jgi:DNA primase
MTWVETLVETAHENLGEREREALWTRGVSDEQIDLFRIGHLNKQLPPNLPRDFLEWCWQGRKFDDVFVLPMTNTLGHIKGLQFRHVDRGRPGYSDFMLAEDEAVMFGLGQAMPHVWATRCVWLVEGAFDLPPIQRLFPNVVATMTARVTAPLVRILRRLANEVWLVYDNDEAGRRACEQFDRWHGQEFRVHTLRYPRVEKLGGRGFVKDPNELWEAWGDDRFGAFLKRTQETK